MKWFVAVFMAVLIFMALSADARVEVRNPDGSYEQYPPRYVIVAIWDALYESNPHNVDLLFLRKHHMFYIDWRYMYLQDPDSWDWSYINGFD